MTGARSWETRALEHLQRRTVGVLSGMQVFGSLAVGVSSSFGSVVAYEVTDSEGVAGLTRTVALLGAALCGLPLASLATRFGRRPALGFGWLSAAAGGVMQTAAIMRQDLWLLLAGLLVFSVGSATGFQARFAGADLAAEEHRTRDLSLIMWMSTVGVVAGPNLAAPGRWIGAMTGLTPMAGLYVISGAGGLIAAVIAFVGLRPDPLKIAQHRDADHADRQPKTIPLRHALVEVWSIPAARFAVISCALAHMVMVVVMTLTAVFMHQGHHGLEAIGLTISLHTLGMFAFSPLVGVLADRIGRGRTVLLGSGVSFGSLLVCLIGQDSWLLLTIGLFGLGLGWSLSMVAGSALLSTTAPTPIRARAQGLSDTLNGLLAAFGAGISGPVMAAFGFGWLTIISMALLVPIGLLSRSALQHR